MRYLAHVEKHKTLSALETSITLKICAVLFINNALLQLLVYAKVDALRWVPLLFKGDYDDFESGWYDDAGETIMIHMAVHVVAWPMREPFVYALSRLKLWWRQSHMVTQHELNQLYEPSQFMLAERNGQLLASVLLGVTFSTGMPVMVLLTLLFLLLQNASDRYMLFKKCKTPLKYGRAISDIVVKHLPFYALVHLAIGTWMIGYSGLDSYTWDNASALSSNLDKFKGRTFNVGERLRHISTLPLFLLLLASMVALLAFHSGRWLCSKEEDGQAGEGEEEQPREPKPDFHLDLCNGIKSYDIAENPKYCQVLPDVNRSLESANWTLGRARTLSGH